MNKNPVYTNIYIEVDERGSSYTRCIRCETITPLAFAQLIRAGYFTYVDNPHFGIAGDWRAKIRIPIVKKGYGCPSCVDEYEMLVVHGDTRAFLMK
jgi:hypothetical protein